MSPSGKVALIDAGSFKGGRAVVQALQQRKITHIDYLIGTHSHADHIGGMDTILKQFEVGMFLGSGFLTGSATYERLLKSLQSGNISNINAAAGQTYDLGGGAVLEVLSPPGDGRWIKSSRGNRPDLNVNINSVVMKLSYGSFVMLFMADAEEETERDLIERKINLKAQVIKIAFHGSTNSSSRLFLEATRAQTAIISCGSDTGFAFPRQETLDRIRQRKLELFRTDLQGDITITTRGTTFEVEPERVVSKPALFSGYTSSFRTTEPMQ
jgi:competence protein ComEC